jgi:uncharacterized protein YecE (DUF72 family)
MSGMLDIEWHIGCSGFYYKEWKEVFYPKGLPQKQWFEFYCQHFNTLEINNTFYRFPELKHLQSWYQRSPGDFLFTVKAPKTITHLKPFIDTKPIVDDFYAIAKEGFKEKLGPILFQLPPRLAYTKEVLDLIISQLDPEFINVLEFRHQSWWKQEVYTQLEAKGIVFSGISYPELPNDVICNGSSVYYRFHGAPKLYFSDYDNSFLRQVVILIQESKKTQKAFLYFNNTAAAAALGNARFVQEFVESNHNK